MNKILTKERMNAMTIKKIIAALISAAIAVPLCTSPALADEPRAVGFDNADDTAVEGFGDITDETASESEHDPNDLYHNSVDMGSDDEPEEGDALLFDDNNPTQLINWMAQTPNPSASPSPTPAPKKTNLANGSFEYPFITPDMLEKVNERAGLDTKARWFSCPENWHLGFLGQKNDQVIGSYTNGGTTYPEYQISNNLNIDYSKIDFGWKTTAKGDNNARKPSDTIELISQTYKYKAGADNTIYRDKANTVTVEDINGNTLKKESGHDKTSYAEGLSAVDGVQCAEIIGRDQSSLYQIIDTFEGEQLRWSLAHIARNNGINKGMLDSMALFIGPAEDGINTGYTKVNTTKGGMASDDPNNNNPRYDMFLWMAEVIYRHNKAKIENNNNNNNNNDSIKPLFPIDDRQYYVYEDDTHAKSNYNPKKEDGKIVYTDNYDTFIKPSTPTDRIKNDAIPVYVHPLARRCANKGLIVRNNATGTIAKDATDKSAIEEGKTYQYTDLVSADPIPGWKEWHCWFMTDTGLSWGYYEGAYDVPSDQSATTLAFTALSGKADGDGRFSEGNIIDDVVLEPLFPLNVTATSYGSGTVDSENVNINNPFRKDGYAVTDTVTITATADTGYSFNGAYIDGIFYHSDNQDKFSRSGNTYTIKDVTMNMGHDIQLVFAEPYTVMYEPNGGEFNGEPTTTKEYMGNGAGQKDKLSRNYTVAASPVPDNGKIQFTGWYFPNAETVIQPGHIVEYVHGETELRQKLYAIDTEYQNKVDKLDEPKFLVTFALAGKPTDAHEYYVCLPADQGLNFIAQWEYKQNVIAMTKGPNDMEYNPSSEGGSVFLVNNNNPNMTNPGFAQTGDKITAKAVVNNNPIIYNGKDIQYKFLGFYEDMEGRFPCSAVDAYTYYVDGPKEIYARFCAELQYPYLSYISEDNVKQKPELANTPFYNGSHVGTNQNGDESKEFINEKGGTNFGNTITTGFIASTKFSSALSDPYCYWDIEIPLDGTTFLKKSNSYPPAKYDDEGDVVQQIGIDYYKYDANIEHESLLDDSEDVNNYFNKGSIYRTTMTQNSSGSTTIKIKHKLAPHITGHALITYGIVLDNVYAPNATALVDYDTEERTGYMDLTAKDPTNAVKASSPEEYISKSPYFNP